MKHIFLVTVFLIFTSFGAQAKEDVHQDVLITVNGMVCDFCAQAILKVLEDYEAFDSLEVDLGQGLVTVHLKPNQTLPDGAVEKSIHYAGYDLVEYKTQNHIATE